MPRIFVVINAQAQKPDDGVTRRHRKMTTKMTKTWKNQKRNGRSDDASRTKAFHTKPATPSSWFATLLWPVLVERGERRGPEGALASGSAPRIVAKREMA